MDLAPRARRDFYLYVGEFPTFVTITSFRLGAEDARLLGRELDGEVNEQDFLALPRYRFYIRLMLDGSPAGPFSGITLLPPKQSLLPSHSPP